METKNINQKQDLLICKSEKPLHLLWKKDRTIMSLKTAKEILLSFKAMGIKEDTACLIFKDNLFHEFRMVGEQHISYFITNKEKKDTSKHSLGSTTIKNKVSGNGTLRTNHKQIEQSIKKECESEDCMIPMKERN